MQITKNFTLREFIDPYSLYTAEQYINIRNVAYNLQKVRDRIKTSIQINSGLRTENRNKQVGGVKNSAHLTGKGADIQLLRTDKQTINQLGAIMQKMIAEKDIQGSIIIYPKHIHYNIG